MTVTLPLIPTRHITRPAACDTSLILLQPCPQDQEHPELSFAVKLKIADLLRCGDEATRAAVVRETERSVLQVCLEIDRHSGRFVYFQVC